MKCNAADKVGTGGNECRIIQLRAFPAKRFYSHDSEKKNTGKAPYLAGVEC
jgi:hypothetical protein